MKRLFQHPLIEVICRWLLGITFIYAGFGKILEPGNFAKILYGYYLFPAGTINLIAIILPFLEVSSGTALILGIFPRSAAVIIMALLIAFAIAIGINLIRGHEFDCGCFTFNDGGSKHSSAELLARDFVYAFLGMIVIWFRGNRKWCLFETSDFR